MKTIKTGFGEGVENQALISVHELMLGMYVCELDRPWKETSFVFQGFVIEDYKTLQQLKEQCEYVYIDLNKPYNTLSLPLTKTLITRSKLPLKKTKAVKSIPSAQCASRQQSPPRRYRLTEIVESKQLIDDILPPPKQATFEQEIDCAQQVHSKTGLVIKNFLQQVSSGRHVDIDIAKKAVYDCMRSILRNPDAMLLMTQLRYKDKYTWSHSMNACILALSLGRHLSLRYEELITLGLCGMLHDIGKLKIPSEILNKPDLLDEHEQAVMRSHTEFGRETLSASPGMPAIIAEVAHNHHERLDGGGFPRGLRGKQISPYVRIISIVDIYDALTTARVDRQGVTHLEALNRLIGMSETELDRNLVHRFIQCLGIYPAGSVVEMTSGEIGIVVEVNEMKKLRPKIVIICDQEKRPCAGKKIDLSDHQYDPERHSYSIKTIIQPESYGIDTGNYFKYGTIQKVLDGL